jgi:hypothetical protein
LPTMPVYFHLRVSSEIRSMPAAAAATAMMAPSRAPRPRPPPCRSAPFAALD